MTPPAPSETIDGRYSSWGPLLTRTPLCVHSRSPLALTRCARRSHDVSLRASVQHRMAPPDPSGTAITSNWLPGAVQIGRLAAGLVGHEARAASAAKTRTAAPRMPLHPGLMTPPAAGTLAAGPVRIRETRGEYTRSGAGVRSVSR